MQRRIVVALAAVVVAPGLQAQSDTLRAPNVVAISPLLVTSGQPSRDALEALGAQGFQAVIYLAPGTVSSAVPEEAQILKRQGIEFVHLPIPFGGPDEGHYQAVAAALSRLANRKVLIHCEVNMRASSMTFLYRTLALHQPPATAYEAVAKVWSPRGPWRALIVQLLRKHDVDFEPY